MKTQIAQKLNDPVVEQLSREYIELQKQVLTLKADIAAMSLHLRINYLLHFPPFRHLIGGSFRTFRRFSQSSARQRFPFCGKAAAMISKQKNFPADVIEGV
jgi:hypothetical protein